MATQRQVFRYLNPSTGIQDIYEGGSGRKIGSTEWGRDWSGRSDVQDLGVRSDLYNQYYPSTPPTNPSGSSSNTDTTRTTPTGTTLRYSMSGLDSVPNIDTLDEESIRERTRKEIEEQIKAIDLAYSGILSQARVEGENRMGQTRAISSRSGTMDTPMGEAQKATTEGYNRNIISSIESEREAKKSALYTKSNQRANDMIEAKRLEISGQKEKANEYLSKIRESAKSDAITFFKAGGKITDLSDEEYANLLNESGMTPTELSAYAKSAGKVSYDYKVMSNGNILITGDDGSMKVDTSYQIPKDKELKQLDDGTTLVFDPSTGSYTNIGNYAKPKSSSGGSTSTGEDKETKAFYDDIANMSDDLANGKKNWGQAFNYIKSRYGAPDDIIDNLLGKDTWSAPGAYETIQERRKKSSGGSGNSGSLLEWIKK
jgi:hypothetical protein